MQINSTVKIQLDGLPKLGTEGRKKFILHNGHRRVTADLPKNDIVPIDVPENEWSYKILPNGDKFIVNKLKCPKCGACSPNHIKFRLHVSYHNSDRKLPCPVLECESMFTT